MHIYSAKEVSWYIWDEKYRLKAPDGHPLEESVDQMHHRIARALSAGEVAPVDWIRRFEDAFAGHQLLPGGRISAGAGSGDNVSLINTFMTGPLPDHPEAIFQALADSATTLRAGGGIGCDFSPIRPRGARSPNWHGVSAGPVEYMRLWERMCTTTELTWSPGRRRGAMMATIRCDHPDIEEFIASKQLAGSLVRFNISVLVTDAFVRAIHDRADWPLRHGGTVYNTVRAHDLWHQIMETTYEYSEPGVIFIDRMNALDNLAYCEQIVGTNSCGEVPMPHHGSCPLASVNLAALVQDPFLPAARLDTERFGELVRRGVRLLDNVIDITRYPLTAQREEALAKRRIGLGITGLADALAMCGRRYGTESGNRLMSAWLEQLRTEAYLASADLSSERGCFPRYQEREHLAALERRHLPQHVLDAVRRSGLRNGNLTALAPTGTMSMLAGNISSGIEPIFSLTAFRRIIRHSGEVDHIALEDFAYGRYLRSGGDPDNLPDAFVTADQLTPQQHLTAQALAQHYIDASISKTINCPESLPYPELEDIYLQAYERGCKGCATYRPSPIRGQVLTSRP